jgi:hypothetical protein
VTNSVTNSKQTVRGVAELVFAMHAKARISTLPRRQAMQSTTVPSRIDLTQMLPSRDGIKFFDL